MTAIDPSVLILGGNAILARRLLRIIPGARLVIRGDRAQANAVSVSDYDAVPKYAFAGVDCVVNCVGTPCGDTATLDRVNHRLAVINAHHAREAGCRRFVQVSSLSVYGRAPAIGQATPLAPVSDYGRSKAAADAALLALVARGFAVNCVRLPALYGPGAAGKFGTLVELMRRVRVLPVPVPLPKRSVLHFDNAAVALAALCNGAVADSVAFAADHDLFDLELLADVVTGFDGRSVKLSRLPKAVFAPLAAVAPGLYASVYADSVIASSAPFTLGMALPVTLRDGLHAMLAAGGGVR